MNTNDQQFLKAYNDLVTAFFNFMNVVSPNNNSQTNLSYIASQLNQVINYLGMMSQGGTPEPLSPLDSVQAPAPTSNPILTSEPISTHDSISNPDPDLDKSLSNPVIKYCAYPEMVNGQYKFKSSALKAKEPNENGSNEEYIYKLTIDEDSMRGYVELAELSDAQVKIVANNPSLYIPKDVCLGANNVTPDKTSIKSQSKLRLEKVLRGWAIAEGEKFILNVD
jgi:hypothetical protein